MLLALAEPAATGLLLAIFGLLMAVSVLFGRTIDRLGVPIVLVFLLLGILGGSEGLGGVVFDDYESAFRLGTIALILILFDGGLNTPTDSITRSIAPAGVLATVGVAGTAAVLATIGRLLGLPWPEALLIGAIVSSTDAAAVFAVLRGGRLQVKERVRSLLEVESCVNDPMAVILTVGLVAWLGADGTSIWWLVVQVPVQLAVGAAVGVGVGLLVRRLLSRVRLTSSGLYSVVTLAAAFLSFGVATLAFGSGFLAVFATGVVLGNGPLPYRAGLTRVHDAVAWISQVSMFLMLGLLVFPSRLLPVAGIGILLGLGLAFVARPLVVTLCLLPFRRSAKEIGYVSWIGIRGAVPIILATIPVMAHLPDAERIFHIVFFIVVFSSLVPGASIVPLTRRLRLDDPEPPRPAAALEIHSVREMDGEIYAYHIDPSVAACGVPLSDILFPDGAAALLVVRGDRMLAARGTTTLEPDDHVYIFCRRGEEPLVGLIFGKTIAE